jgi:anti-sigma factor RsiW
MNCAEFESILADYLDGILPDAGQASVEEHLSACSACREFMTDVNGGLNVLRLSQPVEVPGELITRIAYLAPRGRSRDPFENPGLLSRFVNKWLRPALQPRLAMSMAMTILSFAMLERCTGVQVQRIRPADLSPVRVWSGLEDKALRVRDQAVKYYENLRIVYEVESHLKELQQAQNSAPPARTAGTSSSNPNGSGSSRPSNQGAKQ